MTKHSHRCKNCGYLLEAPEASLCFSCLVADAKSKMSTGLLGYGPVKVDENENRPTDRMREPESSMAEVKKNRPPKSKKKLKSKKAKSGVVNVNVNVYQNRWLSKRSTGLNCVLCGAKIAFGELLAHKEKVHGEGQVSRTPPRLTERKSVWVSVVQGGLPGLGKRH